MRIMGRCIRMIGIITCGLLVLAAASCRMNGVAQTGTHMGLPEQLPEEITLLSWNAQKGSHEEFEAQLKKVQAQFNPSVLMLQEATESLSKNIDQGGVFARSWRYPWPGGDTVGVYTAAVAQTVRSHSLPSRHREFAVTSPKVSLANQYQLLDGRTLLAINAHCLNFERWGTGRLEAQLDDMGQMIARHDGPVLLAGDFNTWSEQRNSLLLYETSKLGLTELAAFSGQRKTGDHGEQLNELLGINPKLPLDRVFYRGLRPLSAEVLKAKASDHQALLARFSTVPEKIRLAGNNTAKRELRSL